MISQTGINHNNLEDENRKLRQINESLNDEINSLKKQLEKTLSASTSLEEMFKKNSDLMANIQRLNDEKEDLKHRLQISLQKNQEILSTYNEEKNNLISSKDREIQELNTQLNFKINEYSKEISENHSTIKSLEVKNQELELNVKYLKDENQKIYQLLTNHFQYDINSYNDIVHALDIIKEDQETTKSTLSIPTFSYDDSERIINKLKSKIKKNKNLYEQTISSQKKEIENLKNEHTKRVQDLDLKIQELQNKNERIEKQKNEILQEKDNILQENAKLSSKVKFTINDYESKILNESLQHNEAINELTNKLHKTESSNEKLKKQLLILIEQLKTYKSTTKTQKSQIEELEKSIAFFENDNSNIKKENLELHQSSNEMKQSNQQLTSNLNELQLKFKENMLSLNEMKTENQKLKAIIEQSTISMEAQNNEFIAIKDERDSLLTTISKNESHIFELDSRINDLIMKNKNLEIELSTAQKKLIVAAEPVNEYSLLPLAAWATGSFPDDLSRIVSDISNNQTLKTPTKLKQIFSIIVDWYQKQTKRIDNDLDETKHKLFITTNNINSFSAFLGKIFGKDYSDILTNEKMQNDLLENIEKLKSYINQIETKASNYEKEMIDFLVFINCDNLVSAKEKLEKMKKKLAKFKDNHNLQKKKNNDLANSFASREKEYIANIKNIQKINNNLQNELDKTQKIIKSLQLEISNLKSQNEENLANAERKIHDISIEYESKLKEYENQTNLLTDKITEITNLRQKSEESKVPLKNEILLLQKSNQYLNEKNEKKNQEMRELKKIAEENLKKSHDIIESNTQAFRRKEKKYQNLIKRMSDESQSESDKYNKSISSLENKNESLSAQNDELSIKLQTVEMKLNTLTEDFERQKRLFESQMKTEALSNEVQFNSKLEECRKKLHEAKISIMGFVASQFCVLFDAKETLDESNFEIFIKNVSDKLNELLNMEWKLRELLKLGPHQSIVDSISSLILKNS